MPTRAYQCERAGHLHRVSLNADPCLSTALPIATLHRQVDHEAEQGALDGHVQRRGPAACVRKLREEVC